MVTVIGSNGWNKSPTDRVQASSAKYYVQEQIEKVSVWSWLHNIIVYSTCSTIDKPMASLSTHSSVMLG